MQKYISLRQMKIIEFGSDFEMKLNPQNRWIQMAHILPWDRLVAPYVQLMSEDKGRPCINPRVVIGALIVKHKLKQSDAETVQLIQENPYIQYFLGYTSFQQTIPFDSSLFVYIRKRMGVAEFDAMTEVLIKKSEEFDDEGDNKTKLKRSKPADTKSEGVKTEETKTEEVKEAEIKVPNQGKLILDATVADQYIPYPNDVMLASTARQWSEKIIDFLHKEILFLHPKTIKVRTYRQEARKAYLNFAKNKKHTKKSIRKALKQQLSCLKRNLGHIENQLELLKKEANWILVGQYLKRYEAIKTLYDQQQTMYDTGTNSCPNRIVNIAQPFVRPIVRGKNGRKVEFGAKINLSISNGFSRISHHSFEAFNEGTKLEEAVEQYKKTYGNYPEVVIADQIYGNRNNRNFLKSKEIRFSGKQLGKPPATDTPEKLAQQKKQKQTTKQESGQRNEVEARFGTSKNIYELNQVRAKTDETATSWVAAIIFLTNVIKFCKLAAEFLCLFLKSLLNSLTWQYKYLIMFLHNIKPSQTKLLFQ